MSPPNLLMLLGQGNIWETKPFGKSFRYEQTNFVQFGTKRYPQPSDGDMEQCEGLRTTDNQQASYVTRLLHEYHSTMLISEYQAMRCSLSPTRHSQHVLLALDDAHSFICCHHPHLLIEFPRSWHIMVPLYKKTSSTTRPSTTKKDCLLDDLPNMLLFFASYTTA